MSTLRDARSYLARALRWAMWGFVVGAAITLPATFAALAFHAGEALHPYLVPGGVLLGPWSGAMAHWPGLVNVSVAAVVNGAIYAFVAGLLRLLAGLRS